jgi:hypothetical protein
MSGSENAMNRVGMLRFFNERGIREETSFCEILIGIRREKFSGNNPKRCEAEAVNCRLNL